MADVVISITVPDAYVARLKAAIDVLDPIGALTYSQQFKNVIRRWTKQYIQEAELQGRDITINDTVVT
jgi:hypothetical protein